MEELEQTPQMNRRSAESVYCFFHPDKDSGRTGGQVIAQSNEQPGDLTRPDDRTENGFQNMEEQ